mmetsp:Transcript_2406/g.6972  ORF Transcript_2406/g.6972 Transcript_2406/m.6972 type:complete len:155 (+) Transcript_2406:466-930(+)
MQTLGMMPRTSSRYVVSLGKGRAVRVERPPAPAHEAAPRDEAAAAAAARRQHRRHRHRPRPWRSLVQWMWRRIRRSKLARTLGIGRRSCPRARIYMLIKEMYGDFLHADNLRGGVPEEIDQYWHDAMLKMLPYHATLMDLPHSCSAETDFVSRL